MSCVLSINKLTSNFALISANLRVSSVIMEGLLLMPGSQSRKRSSFLEHPLCKELNIGTGALATGYRGGKARSLERRCAMDMVSTIQIDPSEETDSDACCETTSLPQYEKNDVYNTTSSPEEYAKNDAYNKNSCRRPQFPTISSIHAGTTSDQCPSYHRDCRAFTSQGSRSEGVSSCCRSSTFRRSTSGNSLFPLEGLTVVTGSSTRVPGRRVRNHRDRFNQKGASSSDELPRPQLPPPLRKLLSSLGNSESLFTNLILGSDKEEAENTTNATATDNVLLNEMRRMEDINIWNTFREREYE